MDPRKRVGLTGAALGLLLFGAACSGGSPGPRATQAPALEGTYRAHSGPNTLRFRGHAWTLTTGERVFSGKFVQAGADLVLLLTFSNHPAYADFCRQDLDVYTVTVTGRSLVLRPVETTAPNRASGAQCNTIADQVFRNGPWTKEG
jgi:hypothetical protein